MADAYQLIAALRPLTHSQTRLTTVSPTEVEARHLGQWEVPDGEEDDGDYDWEVPTDATCIALNEVCERLGWSWTTSEKNWLTFHAKG